MLVAGGYSERRTEIFDPSSEYWTVGWQFGDGTSRSCSRRTGIQMESADLYGPPLVAALCHVNWNFGDGSPPEVVPAGKISPLLLSHAFARKGSFSVFVTAADKDGGVSVAANRVILVQSNLEAWRQQNFGSSANAGAGENSANPMKDGVSNLLKFATGLDPKHPQTMPG